MHLDPAQYWQDLTDNYRRMSDGELLELAEKPEDLTDVAQQVLRDEMKLRKLEKRRAPDGRVPAESVRDESYHHVVGGVFRDEYVPSGSDDSDSLPAEDEPAHEYTWKTLLCDCESNDQAWQLREALKRHKIESWVRVVSASSVDVLGPQVYVAADHLEQAQAVAAQPIPQDIVDDWNTVVPEFDLPVCPQCGSKEEVILESADPVNTWMCEACGFEWSDPESDAGEKPSIP